MRCSLTAPQQYLKVWHFNFCIRGYVLYVSGCFAEKYLYFLLQYVYSTMYIGCYPSSEGILFRLFCSTRILRTQKIMFTSVIIMGLKGVVVSSARYKYLT